jgi:hypothetical protein
MEGAEPDDQQERVRELQFRARNAA